MFISPILNASSGNILNTQKRRGFLVIVLVILSLSILSYMYFPLILFAQASAPALLQPANNSTNIGISDITFTWSPSDNSTAYYLQLSKKSDFSSIVPGGDPEVSDTSYTLEITLEKDTKYYWRVIATQPSQSDWSKVFNFTTGTGVVTPAPTSTPTSEPPSTTPSESEGGSFIDSIGGYIKDIGWPLILAIVVVIVVIILLVFALTSKPKGTKNIPASSILRGSKPPQAGMKCPVCGYANTPDKKFCASCGNSLAVIPPPQYQAPQTQSFTQSSICPNCRATNPPGSQFCGNCGTKLAVQQEALPTRQQEYQPPSTCTNCGALLQPGQKFCGNCGSTITTAGQQVAGVYQTFQCPVCGININRGQNPCPGCNTWLDWGI